MQNINIIPQIVFNILFIVYRFDPLPPSLDTLLFIFFLNPAFGKIIVPLKYQINTKINVFSFSED